MGKGADKKKRNRRKMTPAEHSKRHKTKSIATIFKSTSAEDNEVSPGAPDNQLGNTSEDIDEEQPTDLNDARGDKGCQKIDAALDESVPQLSSNKSKGEELQIQQTINSNSTSTAITIQDQRFNLQSVEIFDTQYQIRTY